MEEKRVVQCQGCQSQYNVAKLQPGAKFKCAKCGTINEVPGAASAPAPAPQAPAAPRPGVPSRPKVNIPPKKTGKFVKPGVKAAAAPAEEGDDGIGGIEVKKSNKMLFIIIGAVVVAIIVIIIVVTSGPSEEEINAKEMEAQKADQKKDKDSANKFAQKPGEKPKASTDEEKTDETKPDDKKPEEPKKEAQPAKKVKFADFVDETVKKDVWEILKKMPRQSDDEIKQSTEAIKAKGDAAVPALILAIGITEDTDDAKQVARYASDILKKITKWEDAPNINPMIGKIKMNEFCEDWKEWYLDKYGPADDSDKETPGK
ncbi:MAG: hypothetical protein V1701_06545 [Planctomycetota bacterium]